MNNFAKEPDLPPAMPLLQEASLLLRQAIDHNNCLCNEIASGLRRISSCYEEVPEKVSSVAPVTPSPTDFLGDILTQIGCLERTNMDFERCLNHIKRLV